MRKAEAQLADRTARNLKLVLERAASAAPRASAGDRIVREHRVDHIVHRLIEAAAQPERLCQMSPTWMPWL